MSVEDSIAGWYERLQAGDEVAASELWSRYFPRLVGLARVKLAGFHRRAIADEEDVAISAFDSFCRRAKRGEFDDVQAKDSLWRVLMTITSRKAARLVRDQNRLKRGGPQARVQADDAALEAMVGGNSPELEAAVSEEFLHLLDLLGDSELWRIALWKMDGNTNSEIGAKLGCAPATVERRIALIRGIWEQADRE